MLVPEDLLSITVQFWPPQGQPLQTAHAATGKDDVSIITGFFDIGRTNWSVDGGKDSSPYRRSTEKYFNYFSNLAKIKNQLIVFTEPRFASKVLDLRRAAGLEHMTVIFTIDNLFEIPEIAPAKKAIAQRMNENFRRMVFRPECPEYNEPRYVLITRLKFSFVCTAIRFGVVEAPQIAWIDFGYCRDDQRFDPATPWRFDAQGKMNLFHIHALDNAPLLHVIQTGDVYFQACHMIGPRDAWLPFCREIDNALVALLACDLIDDEQTLMLMAWRRSPETYIVHAVDPRDWFVVFRRFRSGQPIEPVVFPPHEEPRPPGLMQELLPIFRRRLKTLVRSLRNRKK